MKYLPAILVCIGLARAFGGEVIPPAPARYFNDYAHVVSPATADRLNQSLENFERESSDQILVAVFSTMQSDSSIEDYTVRVARAWKVGQKENNNGAVLFVFVQDRKMFIQVGYGLEPVLPDALCKRIIDEQIRPRFRAGDFDSGLSAGVTALMSAARGEYRGTGRTVAQSRFHPNADTGILFFGICLIVVIFVVFLTSKSGRSYGRGGWVNTGGGWGGFGGGGGGGGFSGGGGGFSGGGGSFGGGGAGGGW